MQLEMVVLAHAGILEYWCLHGQAVSQYMEFGHSFSNLFLIVWSILTLTLI